MEEKKGKAALFLIMEFACRSTPYLVYDSRVLYQLLPALAQ
jgi:hypothetical protein